MVRDLRDIMQHYASDQMDKWDRVLSAAEIFINNSYDQCIGRCPAI